MQPDERNMTFLVIAGTVLVEAVVGFSAILAFPASGEGKSVITNTRHD